MYMNVYNNDKVKIHYIKYVSEVALFIVKMYLWVTYINHSGENHCPACRTSLIATRFWVVMICPIIKCLTVLEFSFILFDLCLFITIFNFILNYVPIVTFWIFTYHKIWIMLIIFCFIWSYCLFIVATLRQQVSLLVRTVRLPASHAPPCILTTNPFRTGPNPLNRSPGVVRP